MACRSPTSHKSPGPVDAEFDHPRQLRGRKVVNSNLLNEKSVEESLENSLETSRNAILLFHMRQ